MPESFIQLVLSSVTDASSRVRTFHGLTESFTLQSSVRQGDPLAPLIYALITDAMHMKDYGTTHWCKGLWPRKVDTSSLELPTPENGCAYAR